MGFLWESLIRFGTIYALNELEKELSSISDRVNGRDSRIARERIDAIDRWKRVEHRHVEVPRQAPPARRKIIDLKRNPDGSFGA